jgi:hypothetical protein
MIKFLLLLITRFLLVINFVFLQLLVLLVYVGVIREGGNQYPLIVSETAGLTAGFISFVIGYGWYLVTIIRGRTKPHLLSWIVLTVISFVMLSVYIAAGAVYTILVPLSNLVFAALVTFFAFRNNNYHFGLSELTKESKTFPLRERIAFFIALAALVIYLFSQQVDSALYLVLVAEVIALTLTLQKTIYQPDEEDWIAWLGTVAANTFNWIAITESIEYAYVFVTSLIDFAIFFFAFIGYIAHRRRKILKQKKV